MGSAPREWEARETARVTEPASGWATAVPAPAPRRTTRTKSPPEARLFESSRFPPANVRPRMGARGLRAPARLRTRGRRAPRKVEPGDPPGGGRSGDPVKGSRGLADGKRGRERLDESRNVRQARETRVRPFVDVDPGETAVGRQGLVSDGFRVEAERAGERQQGRDTECGANGRRRWDAAKHRRVQEPCTAIVFRVPGPRAGIHRMRP